MPITKEDIFANCTPNTEVSLDMLEGGLVDGSPFVLEVRQGDKTVKSIAIFAEHTWEQGHSPDQYSFEGRGRFSKETHGKDWRVYEYMPLPVRKSERSFEVPDAQPHLFGVKHFIVMENGETMSYSLRFRTMDEYKENRTSGMGSILRACNMLGRGKVGSDGIYGDGCITDEPFETVDGHIEVTETTFSYSSSHINELSQILDAIDTALPLAGYKVIDGGNDFLIVRDANSDKDYQISIEEMQ